MIRLSRHARGQAEERRGNNQRDKGVQLEPGDQHDQPDDGDYCIKQQKGIRGTCLAWGVSCLVVVIKRGECSYGDAVG
jgi:hypothetical protein